MARGRRNRGRRHRHGPEYAGDPGDDAAMTGQDHEHGSGAQNPPYPGGARRGRRRGGRDGGRRREEDWPARRRHPMSNNLCSPPYARHVTDFDVIPAAAEPAPPGSSDDAEAPGPAFFDGRFGGGVPNRRCAKCRSVRKANLRLRDQVLQCLERARRLLVAWSAEVGVPLALAADDEMDWQPEPLIRVLLLPAADADADAHPPRPRPPGSALPGVQDRIAAYLAATALRLRCSPAPPHEQPPDRRQPRPCAALLPRTPSSPQAPPGPLPAGEGASSGGGTAATRAPAAAASSMAMAATVEDYDEPGRSSPALPPV